ncbi:MAG: hypothetical protein EBR82_40110, partial [Caulobacteraceae bacterium]|nr:hypothetical protein [Caulobacteraceae bacterium]
VGTAGVPTWATPSSSSGTAATGGVYGVTTLTDSANSTSTTTAATPNSVASLGANVDKARGWQTGIETWARTDNSGFVNQVGASGRVDLAIFTPARDITVGTATVYITTAGSGLTLVRMGLFTWDNVGGTATLVARTANDTTIGATGSTLQSRAFDTTGGYPSTYTLTAGSLYGFGLISVGTTAPTKYNLTIQNTFSNLIQKTGLFKSSQSDLSTVGAWSDATVKVWGRFS